MSVVKTKTRSRPPKISSNSTHPGGTSFPADNIGPYWVLWNSERGLPNKKHRSYGDALLEANRLAKKFPDQKFRILKSVSSVHGRKFVSKFAVKPSQ